MQKESYVGLGIVTIVVTQLTGEFCTDYNCHFSDTKLARSNSWSGKLWHTNYQFVADVICERASAGKASSNVTQNIMFFVQMLIFFFLSTCILMQFGNEQEVAEFVLWGNSGPF